MKRLITVLSLSLTLGVTAAAPGHADGDVRRKGACSRGSEWEMRLIPRDDGMLRVRWDVDSGIAGQTWRMSVSRNGGQLAAGTRTTNADGEAEFRLRGVKDLQGTDAFTGNATNATTGETCKGAASI